MSRDPCEVVWRDEAPHVLAALLRRSGDFEACEDAVQEALVAASVQWPAEGLPDNPRGWLIRVASRRLIDQRRSDDARNRREVAAAAYVPEPHGADPGPVPDTDDTLQMLLLCAHPALSESAQVALTLRAVAGLSTAQIAAAFLVPEATLAQRISRAKAALREAGARFEAPTPADLPGRLYAVRHVLYLTFNEGYATSRGADLIDTDLADEAIRVTERLHRSLPEDTETTGLLALMLLTHARAPARTDDVGDLVPLAEQDRARWDHDLIARGTALVEQALVTGPAGPFALQAAIAGVHDGAATADATDWLQITMLYRMLDRLAPSPTVTLNLAVAVGMAHGPQAGLDVLAPLLEQASQQRNHRVHAARAHLLEQLGSTAEARRSYRLAARLTASIPEQRYLNRRAGS